MEPGVGSRLQHTKLGQGVIVAVRFATYLISFIDHGIREINKEDADLDDIIPEPLGGAHKDLKWMGKTIKEAIIQSLKELDKQKPEKRIESRIDKFCAMGVVVG
mgnify:CR=1 FL=1